MSKKINMLNQVYGMLTVIAEAPSDKSGNAMWECRCECGNIKIIQGRHLRSGNTTSCGCKRIKSLIEYNHTRVKDLTNQKFGKLTALYSIGSNNNKNIIWHCKCECGEECDVASHDLLTGNTKSCGCMRTKSFGENKIAAILDAENIKYIREYTPESLSFKGRFDFYLPDYNIMIEYDGIQHFIQGNGKFDNAEKFALTQKHDAIKTQWCKDNNIPLIRIPYTKYETLCIQDLILDKK